MSHAETSRAEPRDSRRDAALDLLAEAIRSGEAGPIPVSGSCMEPLLRDGDRVSVLPLDDRASLGDLLLARTVEGELVCHRVQAVRADGYVLGGDRTLRTDPHPPETVLGRVTAVHRGDRAFTVRRAGILDRLQVRLHGIVRRRPSDPWIRLVAWPLRLLIERGRFLRRTKRSGRPAD